MSGETAGDPLACVLDILRRRHPAVMADPGSHRLQILLSVPVERDGTPRLERLAYRADAEYFYPASSIKTCAAVAALERIAELRGNGEPVDETTPLVFHPLFAGETLEAEDPSNLDGGAITVEHEVRKLFLVSDNRAFNRLFELAGRRAVNRSTWRVGLDTVRIRHRLSEARTREENRRSPRIELRLGDGRALALDNPPDAAMEPNDQPGLRLGEAHMAGGERVPEPFDFRHKNRISLRDLQDLNVLLLRPDLLPDRPRFALDEAQLELIRRAMVELPRESANPRYPAGEYPDHHVKFFLPGLRRALSSAREEADGERLRVYDKSGRAYGFTVDNAWIVDRDTGRGFFLTAVLYTNPNRTLNDDDYGYEELADPFFADLGEAAARAVWGGC